MRYRDRLTELQASELLIRTSQRGNIKLVAIARWVVDEHLTTLGGNT